MAEAGSTQARKPGIRERVWPGGLSSRLLLLTVAFVALANLLILPPSLASFERSWLLDRVRAAELASLAPEGAPNKEVSQPLKSQLLAGAGVVSIAIQVDGIRRLVMAAPRMERTPYLVDLRSQQPLSWLMAPFQTLFGDGRQMVRVVAEPGFRVREGVQLVEIVTPDGPLRAALLGYLGRLMAVTAFTSALAGVLVYLSLDRFLVRPMQRITRAMERFRADPDDPAARITPSARRDEVGRAEAELDRMQGDLRAALASRARMAALGEAVAKINHDLRNMLTSAQIASERLASSGDPGVAKALPRLERALDRAIRLASDVLAYGKSGEPAPQAAPLALAAVIEGAAEDAGLTAEGVRLDADIPPGARVEADPDQLHRILANLMRNAREAIEAAGRQTGQVRVALDQADGASLIRLTDDGPGLPQRAQDNLFAPFAGSARPGGTGLGLAIARELAQGHGGDLALASTGPEGSVFELRLPGAPEPEVEAMRKRGARAKA